MIESTENSRGREVGEAHSSQVARPRVSWCRWTGRRSPGPPSSPVQAGDDKGSMDDDSLVVCLIWFFLFFPRAAEIVYFSIQNRDGSGMNIHNCSHGGGVDIKFVGGCLFTALTNPSVALHGSGNQSAPYPMAGAPRSFR